MRRALALAAALVAAPVAAQDRQSFDVIERGRYLTTVGDCVACHTQPGGVPFAGGRPLQTPFGTLLSPNLTPDRETGIGAWSDDDFYRAMHKGIAREGAHLYPGFPYTAYTKVTRDDAVAIRAWLATLQPVRNRVETNQLPFPFNVRRSLVAWNSMFFDEGTFQPRADKATDWNRGAYLVQGLGHCGTCHTPKNALGGDQTSRFVHGNDLADWYAPNLTNDGYNGLGRWSVEDIVAYLHDGANRLQTSSGPMAEVVAYSTSHLTTDDLRAIAVYLKDQPGPNRDPARPLPEFDGQMQAGAAIYQDQCAACHKQSGEGAARLFPTLKGSAAVQSDSAASLVRVVLQGAQAVATDNAPTGPAMPAFGWKLNDAETAAVVTYVRNAWGNAGSAVSRREVRHERQRLSKSIEE